MTRLERIPNRTVSNASLPTQPKLTSLAIYGDRLSHSHTTSLKTIPNKGQLPIAAL